MRSEKVETPPSVTIGEGCVVLSRSGQSRKAVANILGQEVDAEGRKTIWLDRLIHRAREEVVVVDGRKWMTSGAISTVLTDNLQ